jgi:Alpha/beta hydrolase domain
MTGFDLGDVGYTLEEFFLESTATCYEAAGPAGADGYWAVTPSGDAPFTTRLVVCRPADPAAFTGTVILEWLNVSAGFDAPAHWMLTHRHVIRSGWAWVGVSAQRAGIEGGSIFDDGAGSDPASRGTLVLPALKESDPARYGALHHPGDAFCFDIFAHGARAVRTGGILGPLRAGCVLAAGQSQSAIHLVTYVNAVAPTVPPEAACDGYLIGCRTGRAAPLSGWDGRIREGEGPDGVRMRTDVAPVLTVQTETDVTGVLAGVTARQPSSDRFRWWEIAGASHADTYVLGSAAFSDSGELPPAALARMMAPTAEPLGMQCLAPVNSGPQHHYVAQAAIAHLDRWARGGDPPPRSPLLEVEPDNHMKLVRDDSGIARGGIRTGWVDVPAAVLSGIAPDGAAGVGMLLGTTRVFDAAELARRYPGGRDEYAAAFGAATERAVGQGFLVAQDADEVVAVATAAYPG